MNSVAVATTCSQSKEDWVARLADPVERDQYFNFHILPIVERELPFYARGKEWVPLDELRGQLLNAANQLLDDAKPEKGDPVQYVQQYLARRALGIWRDEQGNKYAFKQYERVSEQLLSLGITDFERAEEPLLQSLDLSKRRWEEVLAAHKLRNPLRESPDKEGFHLDDLVAPTGMADEISLEERESFEKVLSALSGRERALMELYYRDGLSFREIGTLFSLSESRVSQLHTRIVHKLGELFAEDDGSARLTKTVVSLIDCEVPGVRKRAGATAMSVSAGFLRLRAYIQSGRAVTATAEGIAEFIDGPEFFRSLISNEANCIEATRSALFREGAGLDFEAFSADSRSAFGQYVRGEGPGSHRRRSLSRAIGVPDTQRRAAVVRKRLREIGVFPHKQSISQGFEWLIASSSEVRDSLTLKQMLSFCDGPQFFEEFFSHRSVALAPLKKRFYRDGKGFDFDQFEDLAMTSFKRFVHTLWPTPQHVKRDARIAAALGVGEQGVNIPLMRERLFQIGVYQRPQAVSEGFDRFVRDTKKKADLPCDWKTVASYVDGPKFFEQFLGEDSSRVIRLYKSRLYREHGAIDFDRLPRDVKEAFLTYVREKYPTVGGIKSDYGLRGILQISSRSVVPLRNALEEVGAYPDEELDSSGFYRLTADIADGKHIRASWKALRPYIDSPSFFESFLSRKNANGLRSYKVRLYDRGCPVTKEKLGARAYGHLVTYIRDKYPTPQDVIRDRALGRVFGISNLGYWTQLAKVLVEFGVYSDE